MVHIRVASAPCEHVNVCCTYRWASRVLQEPEVCVWFVFMSGFLGEVGEDDGEYYWHWSIEWIYWIYDIMIYINFYVLMKMCRGGFHNHIKYWNSRFRCINSWCTAIFSHRVINDKVLYHKHPASSYFSPVYCWYKWWQMLYGFLPAPPVHLIFPLTKVS